MITEDLIPFFDWLPTAILYFLAYVGLMLVFGAIFGYLICALRHGPVEGFYVVSRVVFQFLPDWFTTSPRRVWAIAKVAIQEALRRKVLMVAMIIFFLAILIGGWFLDANSKRPHEIYISFLYWGTQLLVLMLGLMVSSFSIPQDIKNRTIFTVSTKPVRSSEIVMGRVLGFVIVGTFLLAIIWVVSYFFVERSLSHSHDVTEIQKIVEPGVSTISGGRVSEAAIYEAESTVGNKHFHRVEINDIDGEISGFAHGQNGHTHSVTVEGTGDDMKVTLGPSEGDLVARVTHYPSDLKFLDPSGTPTERGVNVGNEWDYRSFIRGGSAARAIFKFDGVNPDQLPEDILPMDFQASVFRSRKGNIQKRISASISYRIETEDYFYVSVGSVYVFETQEFARQQLPLPRKVKFERKEKSGGLDDIESIGEKDIFEISPEGNFQIWIKCNEGAQYIGVAKKDMYLRLNDASFFGNFFKSYVGIWLQLLIVVSVGVMFSTFLSGIVAMLSTMVTLSVMAFANFIRRVATGEEVGGGPLESMLRMFQQKNVQTPLEGGASTNVVQGSDQVFNFSMKTLADLVPDYDKLGFSDYLTEGFNIEPDRLIIAIVLTFSFCLVTSVIGYFCLKARELAA